MSAIAIVRYKGVRYIGVFLWEFDRDSADSIQTSHDSFIIIIKPNIYMYILKRHYKEIEKSILHKGMMVKNTYENLKSPCISILTC